MCNFPESPETAPSILFPHAVEMITTLRNLMGTVRKHVVIGEELGLPGDLAPRHRQIFMALSLFGSSTVSGLAARLEIPLASASLSVAQLALAGLVTRFEDPSDHRRTIVELAPEVRERTAKFTAERIAPLERALLQISAEEGIDLARTMARLSHLLSEELAHMVTSEAAGGSTSPVSQDL